MAKVTKKQVNEAGTAYTNAVSTWGMHNQITVRAQIHYEELKKAYAALPCRHDWTEVSYPNDAGTQYGHYRKCTKCFTNKFLGFASR